MHELGIGTMHTMKSILSGVIIPVWTCKAYTIRQKFNIWYSKFKLVNKAKFREQIIKSDFTTLVPRLNVPVYFFSGAYDMTVNYELSKEYLKKLDAPVKGFYTFHNSAHSPMFEEPNRFLEILTNDVLNQTIVHADK
jgi:pimeloyl-ACP methyl ester carboxylesterase